MSLCKICKNEEACAGFDDKAYLIPADEDINESCIKYEWKGKNLDKHGKDGKIIWQGKVGDIK